MCLSQQTIVEQNLCLHRLNVDTQMLSIKVWKEGVSEGKCLRPIQGQYYYVKKGHSVMIRHTFLQQELVQICGTREHIRDVVQPKRGYSQCVSIRFKTAGDVCGLT
jgi:hypothetical protein